MISRLLISIFIISITGGSSAQSNTKYDYHPPLGIPLVLASNFGELRPNHFHMGLDFKTNGRTGYNLYSVEEGFVSRIKISTYGYGKVIYIDHPNGVTSVYAHCSEFKGAIDSIVRATQLKEQNFEVEIFPKKNEINVSKGQKIAVSGNSGGSTAPHLHFELRDTKTEHALNPLLFGFDIADKRKPEIRGVKIYAITKDGYRFPGKEVRRTTSLSGGNYHIADNKINIPASYLSKSGGLGMAFDAIDRLDGANNQCGIYGSLLIVNNDTIFEQQINRIPFESTRYVNCHKDYSEYSKYKRKFHKSFKTKENDLPIYKANNLGVIKANPGDELNVTYIVFDAKGNRSELKFLVIIENGAINTMDAIATDLTFLQPSETFLVKNENTEVQFGLGSVYEPLKIDQEKISYSIGKADIPVHNAFRIKTLSNDKKDGKHYLEIISEKGRRKTVNVSYQDSLIIVDSKYFGQYKMKRDTTSPVITPISLSKSTTTTSKMKLQWKISDTQSGINDYDLFIDDQWVLLEYDYKSDLISYSRPSSVVGQKSIMLRVKDNCGNINEWKTSLNFQ